MYWIGLTGLRCLVRLGLLLPGSLFELHVAHVHHAGAELETVQLLLRREVEDVEGLLNGNGAAMKWKM